VPDLPTGAEYYERIEHIVRITMVTNQENILSSQSSSTDDLKKKKVLVV
jgi:hypothetical protein